MGLVDEASQSDYRSTGIRSPIRSEQAAECGHDVGAAVVVNRECQLLDLGGVVDDAEIVAEPLHEAASDGNGALERIVGRCLAEPVGDSCKQPVLGVHDLLTGIDDEEVAGAVGVLRASGCERSLPEGRGLLVAENARDRHLAQHA